MINQLISSRADSRLNLFQMEHIGPQQNIVKENRYVTHILHLSKAERANYLNSFDTVLCDCDGVIWRTMQQPIQNVNKGIEFLRKAGKHIIFVTNNSVRSAEAYIDKFKETGIEVDLNDVIHPVHSIIKYLEKIKFDGLIYCVATQNFIEVLRTAGFQIIDGPNKLLDESFSDLAKNVFDKEPVRAVIIDVDYNLSAAKLIRAHLYLNHPDCILIGGAADMIIPFGETDIIGPGPYLNVVEKSSGKKAVILGKPGKALGEMVKEQFQVSEANRILFIGDMLETDVVFGKMCGFQTLVVLTGATKLSDLLNPSNDLELPDFYANSLEDFADFLENCDHT